MTLRGFILEDAVASTGRHGTVRGLPLKEVLEQVVPELSISCLRLALSTPKVTEQLLKLDEQGVSSASASAVHTFGFWEAGIPDVYRHSNNAFSVVKSDQYQQMEAHGNYPDRWCRHAGAYVLSDSVSSVKAEMSRA